MLRLRAATNSSTFYHGALRVRALQPHALCALEESIDA